MTAYVLWKNKKRRMKMDRNKLFTINFIIQAVLTTVSQIINIVQQTKKKKDEKTNDQE